MFFTAKNYKKYIKEALIDMSHKGSILFTVQYNIMLVKYNLKHGCRR